MRGACLNWRRQRRRPSPSRGAAEGDSRYHRLVPPKSPLPQRGGLDAAWMRTEDVNRERPAPWATMRDWLEFRLKGNLDVDRGIAEARFVYQDGAPVLAGDGYLPHTFVWFHRDLREEVPVPGKVHVLYRDERIVVVDKPPFLSSIPRGRHITESVVVRMREELGLPELTPMHRLDRVTSGLLLLATEKRWRGAYQSMFMHGGYEKRYRAIAALREDLAEPFTVRSHLAKQHGVMCAEEIEGREPNSASIVELEAELPAAVTPPMFAPLDATGAPLAEVPRLASYRLTPLTGKTHQLRMHLWKLGIPIVGDPLYPVERAVAIDDFTIPLQLLASELDFVDPIDGTEHRFVSDRSLPLKRDA